jgi:hypothetical protein
MLFDLGFPTERSELRSTPSQPQQLFDHFHPAKRSESRSNSSSLNSSFGGNCSQMEWLALLIGEKCNYCAFLIAPEMKLLALLI